MDPFGLLPPELRLEVFLHLETRAQMTRLVRASPAMLRQLRASPATVVRRVLREELGGGLVQDAMAIVLFPPPSPSDTADAHRRRVSPHVVRWQRRELPDPLVGGRDDDAALVLRLDALSRRVGGYVDDYMSKAGGAVAARLSTSYRRAPRWAHESFRLPRLGPAADAPRRSAAVERRLRRAFLQFDVRCRVLLPWPAEGRPDEEEDEEGEDPASVARGGDGGIWQQAGTFACDADSVAGFGRDFWDVGNLGLYDPEWEEETRSWDCDALYCVFEYVASVYGGALANAADPEGWYLHPYGGDLFDRFFDWDMFVDHGSPGEAGLCNVLACFGLDLMQAVFAAPRSRFLSTMAGILAELRLRRPRSLPADELRAAEWHGRARRPTSRHDAEAPGMWGLVVWNLRYTRPQPLGLGNGSFTGRHRTLTRVYRQRAWAFLDGDAESMWFPAYRDVYENEWRGHRPKINLSADSVDGLALKADAALGLESDENHMVRERFESGLLRAYPTILRISRPFWKDEAASR